MDHLQAMRIFARVAHLGSFTKAAEQLQLPRPTVSNAVQYLEKHLKVRLLQRTTRRVALTAEGATYYERCMRLLADLDDAETLFEDAGTMPRGAIRVDLPERFALNQVIPALPGFHARYPDLRVVIGTTDRFVDLVADGIDCAVRVGAMSDTSLVARRIGELAQINCAAPAYLERHGTPRSPDELPDHVAVGYFSSRTGRELDWEYADMDSGQLHAVKMRSVVSVNSSQAYLACCLAGLGLIQAPREGLGPLLADGSLVEVLPEWNAEPLPVSVVFPTGRHLAPRVRIFVDWLAETLGATPRAD
ncbi:MULTISPECIES: LysR family transcriptional regulator [Burkholderia]|uniref:LysR family transcriptional regulator n=1 Tax=Burkholderia lata (strain ATCC 17760 / DSM 23089 / LMG 22485 / NCIMB 9086 / R18194 / 383) TaxID=482957 RepID=A0A6P2H9E1_BURL3|nr:MULTISPECIES: LysR family transcriptional regulator [Burkholderia]MBN3768178.1 LysR family transcriptional regulator [Burkholderia sp. Se-20378]MBN3797257.1 LysR family transcriptional regulator [Burkholderia sp. Ac-20392]VWB13904.1 LysR family transcriptional regulator [Burkholderia lata]VWB18657.1 LysR family transcriptional regulator [Burkholderia lata]VWM19340.1 LysR family transcriptional regulator [Burkholderia lata]